MPYQAGPGRAVRVAYRNRATIDIEPVVGDAELVAAVDDLHGERFVEFPQVDIRDRLAGALQQLRHREHGPDTHFVGLASGNREASKDAQWLEIQFFGTRGAHHHAGRRAIGELAGIARGDDTAWSRGADPGHRLVIRVRPDAFVGIDGDRAGHEPAGVAVCGAHDHVDGHDLVLELAGGQRRGGPLLALDTVAILRFARNPVAAGDGFRR